MIDTLTIGGLRGFSEEQTISFAKPDNKNEGSGLTFIVGANNTGKTTIAEAIRAFNCNNVSNGPTFSSDKRNTNYKKGQVFLKLKDNDGIVYTIKTEEHGGSMTELSVTGGDKWKSQETYVLNSRRSMQYEFSRYEQDKPNYLNSQLFNQPSRSPILSDFGARINVMNKAENRKRVDPMLKEILGTDLEWNIDQNINQNYYLTIQTNGYEHISEGMGDGMWSVFTICDSLYDLEDNKAVVIDEPELSLHPAYQKRVMKLLKRLSKNKQIIINTHSPYFVDTECLMNGASIIRTHKNNNGSIEIFTLGNAREAIKKLIGDLNQPHTFGLEAKEIFFQEDGIIVTEGQEDVVIYTKAAEDLGIHLSGSFFGWGAGGASKIRHILKILQQLGYKKVIAIFDGDQQELRESVKKEFPNYTTLIISQNDVRNKRGTDAKDPKIGLFNEDGSIREEHIEEVKEIFRQINNCFEKTAE